MAVTPKPIKCRSCAKLLATISDSGLNSKSSATEDKACETCQQFLPLYDAMKTADAAYASFSDRRDNYRPKQDAFVSAKKTRMDFNNWLMAVDAADHTQLESEDQKQRASNEQRSMKRSRSRSGSQSPEASTHLQPTSPQCELGSTSLRKRFRFSDDVELREDYRPSQYYARSEETYVRGRYAPPEDGEHLDTSGSAKTFLKFTGMKKVGKEWVDVWKDDEEVVGKKGREGAATDDDASVASDEAQSTPPTVEEGPAEEEATLVDARAQRLARRKSAGSDATTTRKNIAVKNRNKRTTNNKLPIPSEDDPTNSESAAHVGVAAKDAEVDALITGPTKLGKQSDTASHGASDLESGMKGEIAVLSRTTSGDGSSIGEVDGGGETYIARVEAPSASKGAHNKQDLVVSMPPQDGREDHREAAKSDVEKPLEVVAKNGLEDC